MSIPNFQDRVRHKTSADPVTGIVIAKYPKRVLGIKSKGITKMQMLDVRSDDDRIYWATPAENWETISTEEERFE